MISAMIKDAVMAAVAILIFAVAVMVVANTHYQNSVLDLSLDVLNSTPRDPFHVGEIKAWIVVILGFILPFGIASAISLVWFRITSTREERVRWREQDRCAREQRQREWMEEIRWTNRPRRY